MKIRIIVTEDTIDIGNAWPDNPQAKFYPKLDVNLDPRKTKWIESARTNNLYLEGWGGKPLWTSTVEYVYMSIHMMHTNRSCRL